MGMHGSGMILKVSLWAIKPTFSLFQFSKSFQTNKEISAFKSISNQKRHAFLKLYRAMVGFGFRTSLIEDSEVIVTKLELIPILHY